MTTATWKNTVIAEAPASEVVTVEGNLYFLLSNVKSEHIRPSSHTTVCGWKGVANYYDVIVDGETNANAAWSQVGITQPQKMRPKKSPDE